MQFGRELISKETFLWEWSDWLPIGEELEKEEIGGPTEFEMKTALAFGTGNRSRHSGSLRGRSRGTVGCYQRR